MGIVDITQIIKGLAENHDLSDSDLLYLLRHAVYDTELIHAADLLRRKIYGDAVYLRGLIEISNHCKNNCYYCGIRQGNSKLNRYRLTPHQILACCNTGYQLGFRTFVLQGGEDDYYNDEIICELVTAIKHQHPDCAVTLSLGEKPSASYRAYFHAGADRYLLRHETADPQHYRRLHPQNMRLKARKDCLKELKAIGYQVGSGFMVGSPGQKAEHLLADIRFLQELEPSMIGIGPYISHQDTPFAHCAGGSLKLTLKLIALLRLLFPLALIPATTALGTIAPQGRELGLKAGANVVMPNLSPTDVRKLYALYDAKICKGEEAAHCRVCLERRVSAAGYHIVVDRGDAKTPHDIPKEDSHAATLIPANRLGAFNIL